MILAPKNWTEFQHYKDRSPPWIKLHRGLLSDRAFCSLPIASKALAPLLWLLASESKDGTFNGDPEELAFRLRLDIDDVKAGLNPLIEKGFFIIASGVLAKCLQPATPEREGETEGETDLESSNDDSCPPPNGEAPKRSDPIPYQAVADAYNATMAGLAKVRDMTGKRRTRLRTAWTGRRRSLAFWQAYFAECQRDNFLNGTGPYRNGHENWRPDFDYLIREDVVVRTYERAISRMERDNA